LLVWQKHNDLTENTQKEEDVDICSSHLVDVWSSDEEDSMRYLPADPLPDAPDFPNRRILNKRKISEVIDSADEKAAAEDRATFAGECQKRVCLEESQPLT
jgi:hypothetical protein